jgi:hypothetical protein
MSKSIWQHCDSLFSRYKTLVITEFYTSLMINRFQQVKKYFGLSIFLETKIVLFSI